MKNLQCISVYVCKHICDDILVIIAKNAIVSFSGKQMVPEIIMLSKTDYRTRENPRGKRKGLILKKQEGKWKYELWQEYICLKSDILTCGNCIISPNSLAKYLKEPIQRRKNLFNLCDEKLQSELQEIYNNNWSHGNGSVW